MNTYAFKHVCQRMPILMQVVNDSTVVPLGNVPRFVHRTLTGIEMQPFNKLCLSDGDNLVLKDFSIPSAVWKQVRYKIYYQIGQGAFQQKRLSEVCSTIEDALFAITLWHSVQTSAPLHFRYVARVHSSGIGARIKKMHIELFAFPPGYVYPI